MLPRSRYRPWIWMARDYFGDAVEGAQGLLARVLEAKLPERFGSRAGGPLDHPWLYASALLEAAVAAATLAGESYEVRSPSVQSVIDELVMKVQVVPRSTVLQLVADVDVEHPPLPEGYQDPLGQTVQLGGVRVIRVENWAERFIERELPSAGYEVQRPQVVVYPGPVSLLSATVESMAHHESRAREARLRLDHAIAAIRLATGSTVHAVLDIEGDPDRVRWLSPAITPLPNWGFRFVHRPATLSGTDLPGLGGLMSLIQSWGDDPKWLAVRVALGRLGRSLDGRYPSLADQVVDLAIGLEAALGGADKSEIGLRLRARAAAILAADADPPEVIYRDVKTLYDLRSTFVHGGTLSGKAAAKAIKSVAAGLGGTCPAEEHLLALDRWRDLLRRAILARIALATAAIPWALGSKEDRQLDVDGHLLRPDHRSAWRRHARTFWSAQGLPGVANPAPAARLVLGDASEAAPSPPRRGTRS